MPIFLEGSLSRTREFWASRICIALRRKLVVLSQMLFQGLVSPIEAKSRSSNLFKIFLQASQLSSSNPPIVDL